MNVGILGTGNLARALGGNWVQAGHTLVVTGRNPEHAAEAAEWIGAQAIRPAEIASRIDVLVVAVPWEGLEEALRPVGAAEGSLTGRTVVDCTNPVDFASGALKPASGSAADFVAGIAPGARVVKALNLFAGGSWPYRGPADEAPVVPICGDDREALERTGELVRSLGGRAAVFGGLASARQVEEAAGFVVRLVGSGVNPRFAVPDVPVPPAFADNQV